MTLENIKCLNCGSQDSEFFAEENGFTYVKCKKCGLVYLNPRPDKDALLDSHTQGVHEGAKTIHVTGRYKPKKIKRYSDILKDLYDVDELRSDATWLDIGCGFGEFMEALVHISGHKLSVKGTELNEIKIDSCRNRGLNVVKSDVIPDSEKYNFLSLLNIFSHLPDPVSFINDLKKNLLPGGELLLETGHVSHLSPESFPRPFYAPDHLSFANKDIVEDILKRSGFEIVDTRIYRSEIYPELKDIAGVVKLTAKIVLRYKDGKIKNLFPEYPNIDMFIRARLVK